MYIVKNRKKAAYIEEVHKKYAFPLSFFADMY